jgi:hypothetical protein
VQQGWLGDRLRGKREVRMIDCEREGERRQEEKIEVNGRISTIHSVFAQKQKKSI